MNLEGAIYPLLPQVLQKPEWQSLLREPLEWFNTRPRVLPLCSHSVLQRRYYSRGHGAALVLGEKAPQYSPSGSFNTHWSLSPAVPQRHCNSHSLSGEDGYPDL